MENVFKGYLQIEIDNAASQAKMVFTPNPNGEEWSRPRLFELIKQKGIIESVDPEELERALELFQGTELNSVTVVIARGVAPVAPQHAYIKWEEITIPQKLAVVAQKIFKQAPKPEVYAQKIKKVKVEKKVAQKAKGFFFKKTKPVIVVEDRWVKEKVEVSPEVKQYGFIQSNGLIGTIIAGKEGQAGMDIFGRPINANPPKQVEICLGKGISQKLDQISADYPGFLRIGENWIDIIPYNASSFSVYSSKDHADCYLDFIPGMEGAPLLEVEEVFNKAEELGFDREMLLPGTEIKRILSNAQNNKLEVKKVSICIPIKPLIKLKISEEKTLATLTLRKGRGQGNTLSLKQLEQVIKEANLKLLKTDIVRQDVLDFYNSEQLELIDYILAEGIPPEKGENGYLEWDVSFLTPNKRDNIKKRLIELKKASGNITSIKHFPSSLIQEIANVLIKDQKIATIIPPKSGPAGMDVFGHQIEGINGDAVSVELYENLKKQAKVILAQRPGILEVGSKEDRTLLRIRYYRDCHIQIRISDDKIKAFLTILPAMGGGQPFYEEELADEIRKSGIVKGIKDAALKKAIIMAKQGELVNNLLFAQGQAVQHGSGERFKLCIEKPSQKKVRLLADGRADFKFRDDIITVDKDQLVAEIHPPQFRPQDGWNLFGKVIVAKKKAATRIPTGKNIRKELQKDGVVKLFAAISGELVYNKDLLEIKNIHVIKEDLSMRTGNVKFPGTVYVKGSVLSGFSVISEGDIIIDEVVEDALLSAENSIYIGKGIKGSGKAIIRSKNDIVSNFAEQAVLLSVGDIKISRTVLRCTVKCNGRLALGNEKGNLIGGTIKVKKGLECNNLGSRTEINTEVSFGQDYLIGDQIEFEQREIKKLKQSQLQLDKSMREIEKQGMRNPGELSRIRNEKLRILKIVEKRNLRLFNLRERFEEHFPAEIVVRGSVFPGVTLESHGRRFTIKQEKENAVFYFNSKTGKIEEKLVILRSNK